MRTDHINTMLKRKKNGFLFSKLQYKSNLHENLMITTYILHLQALTKLSHVCWKQDASAQI